VDPRGLLRASLSKASSAAHHPAQAKTPDAEDDGRQSEPEQARHRLGVWFVGGPARAFRGGRAFRLHVEPEQVDRRNHHNAHNQQRPHDEDGPKAVRNRCSHGHGFGKVKRPSCGAPSSLDGVDEKRALRQERPFWLIEARRSGGLELRADLHHGAGIDAAAAVLLQVLAGLTESGVGVGEVGRG
jgi:hypothetical protein